MTDAELEEIRALCDAATPGLDSPVAAPGWCWEKLADNVFQVQRCQAWSALFKRAEDAHFVAKSRTLVPRLLDEVEELRAEIERMRPVVEALDSHERRYQTASGLKKAIENYRDAAVRR